MNCHSFDPWRSLVSRVVRVGQKYRSDPFVRENLFTMVDSGNIVAELALKLCEIISF